MSNVCVVSGFTPKGDWIELGSLTSKNHMRYCYRQGYAYQLYTDGFFKDRSPPWSKILFVGQALRSYEWVFWIDADAVFTNHRYRIESFIQKGGDFFICREEEKNMFNTGVFLIHRCEWSFKLLETIWTTEPWNRPYWEQGAFNQLVKEGKVGERMVFYPMRAFNSIPEYENIPDGKWQQGDFVAHRVDHTISGKTEILRKYAIME